MLAEYEHMQRPKFDITRKRTYRHLQLYAPYLGAVATAIWKRAPAFILGYYGSIFAYDYEVYDPSKQGINTSVRKSGVVGNPNDPLHTYVRAAAARTGRLLIAAAGVGLAARYGHQLRGLSCILEPLWQSALKAASSWHGWRPSLLVAQKALSGKFGAASLRG